MKNYVLGGVFALALWALSATTTRADLIFTVTMDISALTDYTGPYGIAFDMISGGSASSNTATISDFTFGGATMAEPTYTMGNVSGDLAANPSAGITLEVDPVNSFAYFDQGFTSGSTFTTLSFQVDLTTNPGSTPDTLAFLLVQNYTPGGLFSGSSTPILTPALDSSFFDVSIGPGATPVTYSSSAGDISAPTITPAVAAPEPSTLMLSAISLASFGLAAGWKRLRRRVAAAA